MLEKRKVCALGCRKLVVEIYHHDKAIPSESRMSFGQVTEVCKPVSVPEPRASSVLTIT